MITEKQIITALKNKPLCSENLLYELGISPGGGELVIPIRNLIEHGIIIKRKTFIYELRID